jgi:hypothetical protein
MPTRPVRFFRRALSSHSDGMRWRIAMGVLVMLLSFSGVARANIFASGPVYGGPTEDDPPAGTITCRIFNAGLTTVTINLTQIWTNSNALVAPVSNTCLNIPLGPARYCAYGATILGNFAFSCRINVTGTDTNVRGVAEIQRNGIILNVLPIH